MEEKELHALLRLLDDEDNEIYNHIENRFLSYGKDVIPFLEDAWGQSFDAIVQQRIESLIHKIQFEAFIRALGTWKRTETQDHHTLLKGAILVAQYQYPDLDEEKIHTLINQIRKDTWMELNDNLTALEKVNVLNHVFFNLHGFSGNTTNYHAPQNSYINNALESRKGNPLMLSLVYSVVAQSLDIPVFGVNLPEHFILAYKDTTSYYPDKTEKAKIFFYINAFSRGTVFGKKEIDAFIKQLGLQPEDSYYEPCSNLEIMQRLLRNLIYSYQKLNETEKVEELKIALKSLSND
jgi:regulator of sirC expression with transglutaminase-like and TPR domain